MNFFITKKLKFIKPYLLPGDMSSLQAWQRQELSQFGLKN
jgi:hypothetical protein